MLLASSGKGPRDWVCKDETENKPEVIITKRFEKPSRHRQTHISLAPNELVKNDVQNTQTGMYISIMQPFISIIINIFKIVFKSTICFQIKI